MNRQRALKTLSANRSELKRFSVKDIYIFGSVARDEAAKNSDVDVVVSLEKPNLFTLSRIRQELEQEFHQHVDIVSLREKMNPTLKAAIQQEARYV